MILQSLYQLYDRLADDPDSGITPVGYAPQKISFRVIIKSDGSLFSITPATKSVSLIVPEHKVRSGSKILPQFLCDKANYCLGIDPKSANRKKFEKHFNAFKEMHLSAEAKINSEKYSAFCRFLKNWDDHAYETFDKKHPGILAKCINFGVFEIQGDSLAIHEISKVKDYWDRQEPKNAVIGQCLITGEILPLARLHPKIKGFNSATALVGVQKNSSYESYKLKQALTAQTSEKSAFKYASALTWMLNGKGKSKHRIYIADTTCVFWTDSPSIFENIAPLFFASETQHKESQDEAVRLKLEIFLKVLRKGSAALNDLGEDPQKTKFYILGLEQPNPGRFSIRFFYSSSIAKFLKNIQSHHDDISIIREYEISTQNGKAQPEYPNSKDLINQTALKLSSGKLDYKTIPPLLGGSLMRAILENTRYPEGLYSAVIRRIRADRTINYFRACIIKGTLTRNHNQTIPIMLDKENKEPAYLLGRLFATLEKIQEEGYFAQNERKIKNTIRDKYFSSACTTPVSVFPRLETLSTHHRRHLSSGRKTQFDQLIGDIKWEQKSTKKVHTLQEQGIFILGYYHQRKDFFTKKEKPETSTTENQESN